MANKSLFVVFLALSGLVGTNALAEVNKKTGVRHMLVHITNSFPLPYMSIGGRPPDYRRPVEDYPPYRPTLHWRLDGSVETAQVIKQDQVALPDHKYAVAVPVDLLKGRLYGGTFIDLFSLGAFDLQNAPGSLLFVPENEFNAITTGYGKTFKGKIIPYEYNLAKGKFAGTAINAFLKANRRDGYYFGDEHIRFTFPRFTELMAAYAESQGNPTQAAKYTQAFAEFYDRDLPFEAFEAYLKQVFGDKLVWVTRAPKTFTLFTKDRDLVEVNVNHTIQFFAPYRTISYANGKSFTEKDLFDALDLKLMEPHKLHSETPLGNLELDILKANPYDRLTLEIEPNEICDRVNKIRRRIISFSKPLDFGFEDFLQRFYTWYDSKVFGSHGKCEEVSGQ